MATGALTLADLDTILNDISAAIAEKETQSDYTSITKLCADSSTPGSIRHAFANATSPIPNLSALEIRLQGRLLRQHSDLITELRSELRTLQWRFGQYEPRWRGWLDQIPETLTALAMSAAPQLPPEQQRAHDEAGEQLAVVHADAQVQASLQQAADSPLGHLLSGYELTDGGDPSSEASWQRRPDVMRQRLLSAAATSIPMLLLLASPLFYQADTTTDQLLKLRWVFAAALPGLAYGELPVWAQVYPQLQVLTQYIAAARRDYKTVLASFVAMSFIFTSHMSLSFAGLTGNSSLSMFTMGFMPALAVIMFGLASLPQLLLSNDPNFTMQRLSDSGDAIEFSWQNYLADHSGYKGKMQLFFKVYLLSLSAGFLMGMTGPVFAVLLPSLVYFFVGEQQRFFPQDQALAALRGAEFLKGLGTELKGMVTNPMYLLGKIKPVLTVATISSTSLYHALPGEQMVRFAVMGVLFVSLAVLAGVPGMVFASGNSVTMTFVALAAVWQFQETIMEQALPYWQEAQEKNLLDVLSESPLLKTMITALTPLGHLLRDNAVVPEWLPKLQSASSYYARTHMLSTYASASGVLASWWGAAKQKDVAAIGKLIALVVVTTATAYFSVFNLPAAMYRALCTDVALAGITPDSLGDILPVTALEAPTPSPEYSSSYSMVSKLFWAVTIVLGLSDVVFKKMSVLSMLPGVASVSKVTQLVNPKALPMMLFGLWMGSGTWIKAANFVVQPLTRMAYLSFMPTAATAALSVTTHLLHALVGVPLMFFGLSRVFTSLKAMQAPAVQPTIVGEISDASPALFSTPAVKPMGPGLSSSTASTASSVELPPKP